MTLPAMLADDSDPDRPSSYLLRSSGPFMRSWGGWERGMKQAGWQLGQDEERKGRVSLGSSYL